MTDTATDGSGVVGQAALNDPEHPYNTLTQFIDAALGKIATVKLVKVMGIGELGGVGPVGFVDVKIMTNLVDGLLGSSMEQDTVFHLPYFRYQGGANAFILEPAVGDIGFAVVCDRDISSVKNNRDTANPGSFRRFSIADGLYVGGILNDTPTQYIQFTSNGIKIRSGTGNIDLNGLIINQSGQVQGALNVTGEITAKAGTGSFVTLTGHITASFGTPPTPGH